MTPLRSVWTSTCSLQPDGDKRDRWGRGGAGGEDTKHIDPSLVISCMNRSSKCIHLLSIALFVVWLNQNIK